MGYMDVDLGMGVLVENQPANKVKTAAHVYPGKFDVSVISDFETLRGFAEEWKALEATSEGTDFFQSWAWCQTVLDHKYDDPDFSPFVVVVKRDGAVQSLLPLCSTKRFGQKILTGFAEPYQQYTDMLILPDADPKVNFDAMRPYLNQSDFDLLHLGQVREDSKLFEAIAGNIKPSGEVDAAPYVPVSDWPDFETYFKTLNSKTRKNMRNARNRLAKSGSISHEVCVGDGCFSSVVERTFKRRSEWLAKTGMVSRAFSDEQFKQLLDRLAATAEEGKSDLEFLAMSLKHGDRFIAEQWGFVHKGCYYAFLSGWDSEYDAVSPGKLHLEDVIRTCYEHGLERADFMIPSVPYKQTWARGEITVRDYVLPISTTGYLYNRLWLNCLRPLAKKAYCKIPCGIRGKFFNWPVKHLPKRMTSFLLA